MSSGARVVTPSELAEHGADAGTKWIAVHGEVFDVSSFAQLHPGGRVALERHCGTDASAVFAYYHHSGVLGKYRAKLKVGELAGYVSKRQVVPFSEPGFFGAGSLFRSPYYKETHRRFHARVSAFVRDRLLPSMPEWEHDKAPPRWVMEAMGKEGFLACLTGAKQLPRQYLDAGVPDIPDYDLFHETVLLDCLSKTASPNVMAALTSGVSIALTAVIAFGTQAQKARVVREVLMGREMIALAVSEPNAGSDVAGMAVEARKEGGAWLVNGTKKWITNAAYSKWLVTAVRTAPERPATEGTSLLLIDAELPGISMRKVGLRPEAAIAGTSFIEFDNVRVGADMLVGRENAAFVAIMSNFNHEVSGGWEGREAAHATAYPPAQQTGPCCSRRCWEIRLARLAHPVSSSCIASRRSLAAARLVSSSDARGVCVCVSVSVSVTVRVRVQGATD
jgi:alkylation response protein AidB-like acyl-CoA dehydrogenase